MHSILLLAVLGAALAYFLRAQQPQRHPAPLLPQGHANDAIPVTVATARHRALQRTLTVIGVVRPDHQSSITAKVPSRVAAVYVHGGEFVRAGDMLARLDIGDAAAQIEAAQAGVDAAEAQYRKAVEGKTARLVEVDASIAGALAGLRTALAKEHQAELGVTLTSDAAASDAERAAAGVKQAQAGLSQAEVGLQQAQDLVRRLRFLYAHGGVARADLEGAEAQAEIARAQRDAAAAALQQARAAEPPASKAVNLRREVSEGDVAAAKAGVEQARKGLRAAYAAKSAALRLADQDIRAARAALLQAKAQLAQAKAQVGGSVLRSPITGVVTDLSAHAGDMAQPGMPLMTVVAASPVHVEAEVPARYASRLKPGLSARVNLEGRLDAPLAAVLTQVLPIASPDGRTVPIRLEFTSSAHASPGLMAKIVIDLPVDQRAVSIPMDALRTEGDTYYVYIVEGSHCARRNVDVAVVEGQYAQISGGLQSGDRVIVTSEASIEPGMPVKVVGRR
ncbi:MAG: efflux RND transporter periplasmic adaptor subunit [Chthonomonadales bacterium]